MARVLCISDGMTSVVYSILELARRLAADGHDVIFCGKPERRALAEHLDVQFRELEPSETATASEAEVSPYDAFADALRRLEPDLVLVDGEMHEHIVVSAGAGVRTGLLNTFCSIWRRPGLPPPHCLIRPGVGWRGSRLGMALFWVTLRMRKRFRALSQRVSRRGADRISRLRRLADRHGFDLSAEADPGQWLIPFTYRSLAVLSLHALEFEFPHEPPQHVRYVGPMVLRDRGTSGSSENTETRLDAVLNRNDETGRKLVYAGFGSTFTARRDLVRRLAAAAEGMPWDLVVSLGGTEPSGVSDLPEADVPENVHVFRWLPQLRVLEYADAAVVHGGINTVDECVFHGVPMLVYCGFETDMAGNTARVVHHGLGLAGDPRRDEPLDIRRHLERLLDDGSFRANVERFRERYEAYEHDRAAERAVTRLLDDQP